MSVDIKSDQRKLQVLPEKSRETKGAKMSKNAEVCQLLDILTLDMLDLMEQQVQCKVNIEKQTAEGDILLAKARYIQGVSSVSSTQLPTECTPDFQALSKVVRSTDHDDGVNIEKFALEKHPIDRDEGYVNPLNWFGVLVPRCLQQAKDKFEKAVELVVETANVQNELRTCIASILSLRNLKHDVELPKQN